MGRIGTDGNEAKIFYWPGTSVTLHFVGTSVKVKLKDERGENYFYVIVDDTIISKLKPDSTLRYYTIASGLKAKKHSLQLYKLTESKMGKTWFYGFQLEGGDFLDEKQPHKRKIEFYGNSITVGYSLEDTTGDANDPKYYNNYYSYASITARHYNASYNCIAKSGIGLMVSWFPIIMPEMFDRLDATDSTSKWDFSLFTPDVVVINLLQNDSWLVHKPDHPQFKARFGTTAPDSTTIIANYAQFIRKLRSKYPAATIICALGSMDATKAGAPWPRYIEKAVGSLNDNKILTCFFPYKNTPGHPKKKEQAAMADQLIKFIDAHVVW